MKRKSTGEVGSVACKRGLRRSYRVFLCLPQTFHLHTQKPSLLTVSMMAATKKKTENEHGTSTSIVSSGFWAFLG